MKDQADQIFRVSPKQADKTLAATLRHWLPKQSWSQIQRLLKARHVLVNGNLCVDAGRRLKVDEVIKVLAHPTAAPPKASDLKIRYADAHVVVVEKPAGMTSIRHSEERKWVPRRKQLQPTLDELLPQVLAQRSPRGARSRRGRPVPLRAVHRLDRETSGLMVFARTVKAERHLGLQFRAHTVQRRYIAIVPGHVDAQTISTKLVRDRGDGRRGSRADDGQDGKLAVTHIKPIERLRGYTVVECRLETGRTHQIRIHLSELGHPVCGDKVYRRSVNGVTIADESVAPRLALHAAELGFMHPHTGETTHFKMPLQADLAEFLNRLRREQRR